MATSSIGFTKGTSVGLSNNGPSTKLEGQDTAKKTDTIAGKHFETVFLHRTKVTSKKDFKKRDAKIEKNKKDNTRLDKYLWKPGNYALRGLSYARQWVANGFINYYNRISQSKSDSYDLQDDEQVKIREKLEECWNKYQKKNKNNDKRYKIEDIVSMRIRVALKKDGTPDYEKGYTFLAVVKEKDKKGKPVYKTVILLEEEIDAQLYINEGMIETMSTFEWTPYPENKKWIGSITEENKETQDLELKEMSPSQPPQKEEIKFDDPVDDSLHERNNLCYAYSAKTFLDAARKPEDQFREDIQKITQKNVIELAREGLGRPRLDGTYQDAHQVVSGILTKEFQGLEEDKKLKLKIQKSFYETDASTLIEEESPKDESTTPILTIQGDKFESYFHTETEQITPLTLPNGRELTQRRIVKTDLKFQKKPPYLMIQSGDYTVRKQKDIPQNITLTPGVHFESKDNIQATYGLKGFIYHTAEMSGQTPKHYITYIQLSDGWYRYDNMEDSKGIKIQPEEMPELEQRKSFATMYLYKPHKEEPPAGAH